MVMIPFGTNGFFDSYDRKTMCFVVPHGKILLILDAGSGLFRFVEPAGQALLTGVEEVHIFLSHYHLDHTFGMYAAFRLFEGKKVKVFAPDGKQRFSDSLEASDFPEQYVKHNPHFSWNMLGEGSVRMKDYVFSARRQNHRGEISLGYRFQFPLGNELAYITDTDTSQEGIDFVKGVQTLLHEHYFPGPNKMIGGHVSTVGAATTAKKASVDRLVLVHHNPFFDTEKLKEQLKIAQNIFPKTILAKDLHAIEF